MSRIFFLVIFMFTCSLCLAQNSPFIVQYLKLQDKDRLLVEKPLYFYEDDQYTVDQTCMGEFGGEVIFRDKATGKKFSCNSTCTINVNRLSGKYYITSSLAHMGGFTSIKVVEDPSLLKANSGYDIVVDSIGILTLGTYINGNQLFHIIADEDNTYLAQVTNGSFDILDTLVHARLFVDDPVMRKNSSGEYILEIRNLSAKSSAERRRSARYIIVKDHRILILSK